MKVPINPWDYDALRAGALAAQNGPADNSWRSMDSAPRDGTVIETMCIYSLVPWYGLFRWSTKERGYSTEGFIEIENPEPRWVCVQKDKAGSLAGESNFKWRPYDGEVDSYVDPTGGKQDSMAYWRGAVAVKHGLPIDYFEAQAAANRNARQDDPAPTKKPSWWMSLWRRILD